MSYDIAATKGDTLHKFFSLVLLVALSACSSAPPITPAQKGLGNDLTNCAFINTRYTILMTDSGSQVPNAAYTLTGYFRAAAIGILSERGFDAQLNSVRDDYNRRWGIYQPSMAASLVRSTQGDALLAEVGRCTELQRTRKAELDVLVTKYLDSKKAK